MSPKKFVSRLTAVVTWLVVVASPQASLADILIIDLNDNPKEVEAVIQAAIERKEGFRVIPSSSKEYTAEMRKFKREADEAQRKARVACRQEGAACQAAEAAYNAVITRAGRQDASGTPLVTKASLARALAKLRDENVNVTSVVVSGHDGNGKFSGVYGTLSDLDLAGAFEMVPALRDGVRSLLLWGCYTTTVGSLDQNWKEVFPNVTMIAGFNDRGPLGTDKRNWPLLKDTLIKERRLTNASDKAEMLRVFRSLDNVGHFDAAICVKGDDWVRWSEVKSLAHEIALCENPQSNVLQARFNCYLKAEPGCEDIPKETGSGELREFYKFLQDTKHCTYIWQKKGHFKPKADKVNRLMFDREVRANFEARFKSELHELNGLLSELGFSDDLRLEGIGLLKRKEFLDRLTSIRRELNEKTRAAMSEEGGIEDERILTVRKYIEIFDSVSDVEPNCVPFAWTEIGGGRVPAGCGIDRRMSEARVEARLEASVFRYARMDHEARTMVWNRRVHSSLTRVRKDLRQEMDEITSELTSRKASPRHTEEMKAKMIQLHRSVIEIDRRLANMNTDADQLIAKERAMFYENEVIKASARKESITLIRVLEARMNSWRYHAKLTPLAVSTDQGAKTFEQAEESKPEVEGAPETEESGEETD